MRDIIFRGKRLDKNEWVYGHYNDSITTNGRYHYIQCTPHDNANQTYRIRPETVGQFTGLHDKNGKEIYEGDIVSFVYVDFPDCVVVYDGGSFMYREIGEDISLAELRNQYVVEVIGNVHDNKELLKGGNQ